MEDSSENNIIIQLGDILNLIAPDNIIYNDKLFLVKYIDNNKITLININEKNILILKLLDGELEESSIETIELISRADDPGYAKQNNLILDTWIDIYFNIEVPFILTGKITDLENDMIEITSYPTNEIIYIDFDYKGLPESLSIDKIIIRTSPSKIIIEENETNEEKINLEDEYNEKSPKELNEILIDADQILIGEKVDSITLYVDAPDNEMRDSINKQTTDLLDELLAVIPNYK